VVLRLPSDGRRRRGDLKGGILLNEVTGKRAVTCA